MRSMEIRSDHRGLLGKGMKLLPNLLHRQHDNQPEKRDKQDMRKESEER